MKPEIESRKWGWLILFASTTTLVCCALPIILVTLGMGAVSAALFSNLPFLADLARHKVWFFSGSFILLALAAWTLYRPGRTCPVDPVLARRCLSADKWNRRFLWSGGAIWSVGFAAAYLALPILEWIDP
jgi:mercuric ion transport protein